MKRRTAWLHGDRIPTILSVAVLALVVLVQGAHLPVLHELQQRIEALAFDARLRLTLPGQQEFDPQVVIVDVDEKSLAAEGHWPWPRARIAALIQGMADAGAAVIAFDFTFPEADRNAASEVLGAVGEELDPLLREALAARVETLDHDRAMADALAANPVLLGFTFTRAQKLGKGALPASTVTFAGDIDKVSFLRMPPHLGNIEVLQRGATGAGFFTVMPEFDGVIRRVPTVVRYGDKLYASLALEAMRLTLGADSIEVITRPIGDKARIERISIGGMLDIPTDGEGQVIVPYRGRSPQYLYVSATDVLRGNAKPGVMEGSIVLVGSTAEGLKDLRSTPMQAVYPGVEIHANVVSALFGSGFPVAPPWALGADIAILLVTGLLGIVLFSRLSPILAIVVAFVLVGAVAASNIWLWREQLVLSLATPVITLLAITFIHVIFRFLDEARSRRSLRDAFGQYVPTSLVEQMYEDPDKDFGFEGESRVMSVLFSDIRGFTTLSESLGPHTLKQFLNAFFTPLTEIIFRHQGTIDKYVGDMVMAFWGAPVRDVNHRQHAIDTALDMLAALPALGAEFAERGWPVVEIGIGINSGAMNVGDMGSSFRRSYTVIGDAVNLASRLEGLTKYYGVKLLVSEASTQGVTGVVLRHLDRVRVKGKKESIELYEVVCREAEADAALRGEIAAHHEALAAYLRGAWDEALAGFTTLRAAYPQRAFYELFVQRIGELRGSVDSAAWDGVYEHLSK
jgi:adenylate cyclase